MIRAILKHAWFPAFLLICSILMLVDLEAGVDRPTARPAYPSYKPLCEMTWLPGEINIKRITRFTHCWIEMRCQDQEGVGAHWIWTPMTITQAETYPGRYRVVCQEPWWPQCMTGPGSRPGWLQTDGCLRFDWNVDGDVDLRDYALWSRTR